MDKRALREALNRLSGSELSSLLMETFAERAHEVPPREVMKAWENDRFVQPARTSPLDILKFDSLAYAAANGFEPIELSPVAPLATNVAVAPMSQKKVLSSIRSSEVVADSTNVMALFLAVRRRQLLKQDGKNGETLRMCSSHRLLRVQKFPGAFMAHFRVFGLCSAGRDTGSFRFEVEAMAEQIGVMCKVMEAVRSSGREVRQVRVDLYGENTDLLSKISSTLRTHQPDLRIENVGQRKSSYYPVCSFKMYATNAKGEDLELADGGITDWTQKLLGSSKERFMISGIGTDRVIENFF